jgi:hypothetical protein
VGENGSMKLQIWPPGHMTPDEEQYLDSMLAKRKKPSARFNPFPGANKTCLSS